MEYLLAPKKYFLMSICSEKEHLQASFSLIKNTRNFLHVIVTHNLCGVAVHYLNGDSARTVQFLYRPYLKWFFFEMPSTVAISNLFSSH